MASIDCVVRLFVLVVVVVDAVQEDIIIVHGSTVTEFVGREMAGNSSFSNLPYLRTFFDIKKYLMKLRRRHVIASEPPRTTKKSQKDPHHTHIRLVIDLLARRRIIDLQLHTVSFYSFFAVETQNHSEPSFISGIIQIQHTTQLPP